MKAKIKIALSVLIALSLFVSVVMLGGCFTYHRYSFSINNDGCLVVTYPDGTTDNLGKVDGNDGLDGKDGTDGSELSVMEAYQSYIAEKGLSAEEFSYSDFIKEFLTVNSDNSAVIGQCLLSSMKVYSEFRYTTTTITGGWMRPGSTTTIKNVGFTQGSAVIYSMNSTHTYILTNYHVVYYSGANSDNNGGSKIANKIYCYLYGSEGDPEAVVNETGNAYKTDSDGYTLYDYGSYGIQCEFIGGSVAADIAVLKANTNDILAVNKNAKAVTLASDYFVGQTAIAVGNTEGEGISVTEGIVSVDNEVINYDLDGDNAISSYEYYRCLRIDTAIYSGNSGGGLFNTNGELIGITNAGDTSDQNINYAIPIGIVTGAADNIIYYYEKTGSISQIHKMILGVEVVSQNAKYVYDYSMGLGTIKETVLINNVTSGSVAETIGLKAGDVIVSLTVDGCEHIVDRTFDISDILYKVKAGSQISVTYTRDGTQNTTSVHTVLSSNLTVQN